MAGDVSTGRSRGIEGAGTGGALALMTTIFFMWGFATVLNDILIPHFKDAFQLSYRQAYLVNSVWFITYFLMSLPTARVVARIGYKASLVLGLGVMASGALLFVPAAELFSYPLFLVALFVLASGVTLLQVAANPYVAVLGRAATASARLSLAQAFNTLGDTIAGPFGRHFILARSAAGVIVGAGAVAALSQSQRIADLKTVQLPYALIAAVLLVLALLVWLRRLPDMPIEQRRLPAAERAKLSLWAHRNLVWAVPAIAVYVLAEVAVGSSLVSFISSPEVAGISHEAAAFYLQFFWGGMMIGRFAGSYALRTIRPEVALGVAAALGTLLMLLVVFGHGPWVMWPLIAVGLCNSIMFPTIFTLGIRGLGTLTEEGSGLLIAAIVGGAGTYFQALVADRYGLQVSYLIPAACYLYILTFALSGARARRAARAAAHRRLMSRRVVSVADRREAARKRLPRILFDYIDGGSYAEATLERNVADMEALALRQRVMRDMSSITMATTLFGQSLPMPVILGPVGFSGMYARRGEVQAARAALAAGIPFSLSTLSICALDEVARVAPPWFQLYVTKDREATAALIARARAVGSKMLLLTVDLPTPGARYRDVRSGMSGKPDLGARVAQALDGLSRPAWMWDVYMNGRPHGFGNLASVMPKMNSFAEAWSWIGANFDPSIDWADIAWVRQHWDGPLVVKGVLDPEDARAAADAGADGIVVSNHGGRQLDGALSTVAALPPIVDAVGDRLTVLMDGGVRSGLDVLKALALGAKGVLLGRAWAFALGAGGEAGVAAMLGIIRAELRTAMVLTGCNDVTAADGSLLVAGGPARR